MHRPKGMRTWMVALVLVARASGGASALEAASREQELLAVIRSETPEADKALAFKGLAVHGSPACVGDVATYLGNERLASWARITLEAIPGEEASAALRAAIVDEKLGSRLRVGVINSLGVRRDAAAVSLLTTRLGDADPNVASAAAAALGKVGTAEAAAALRSALAKGKPARDDVAEACVVCGESLVASGNSAAAIGLFDAVRGAEVSEQRQAEAARGAILARGREGLPLLVELLQSPSKRLFNMGLFAARHLASGADRDASDAYEVDLAILKSLAPTDGPGGQAARRGLLIDLLADRNERGASSGVRQALLDAAHDGDAAVQGAAIRALGRCGDASSAAGLLDLAAGAGPDVAAVVRQALATMPAEGVDDVILARMTGGDAAVLPLAIGLVGDRRIVSAAAQMLPLADHADAGVRAAALAALGSVVGLEDLRTLVRKVTAPRDDAEAQAAATALKEAAVRMADRDGCAAAIAEAIGSAGVRAPALLETLADVGGGKALATVAAAAKSGDPALQDAATRVLGKWMTADAAPVLLDLATGDAAGSYSGRAFKGYLRIARQFALSEPERAEMCRRALAVARDPADRKGVIEILVRYPHAATLAVAREAVALPDVAEDAKAAVAAIEGKIGKQ